MSYLLHHRDGQVNDIPDNCGDEKIIEIVEQANAVAGNPIVKITNDSDTSAGGVVWLA